MKVTVCQLPDSTKELALQWPKLAAHLADQRSEMLVLPELPFFPWPADEPFFSAAVWEQLVKSHYQHVWRLPQLSVRYVAGTMPVNDNGRRYNVGFIWAREHGLIEVHRKHYLPEMAGFYESTWFDRGPCRFEIGHAGAARLGFAICTEIWATDLARHYAQTGAHFIVTPRATGCNTIEKWLAAGRTAGVVAGAFSLSSNRFAPERDFGGGGWITDPDGTVLALTTTAEPFITVDCALSVAESAKATYPRDALNRDAAVAAI